MERSYSYKNTILKGAFLLYFRKAIAIFIGLYSSRLLLNHLGIDDFGLYGLIGSIVVMFNAIRFLFSDSIQRYINIAKGNGNISAVQNIFSMGVQIHYLLAGLFLVVGEISGVILLPHVQSNVPYWELQGLFQLCLLSSLVTIITVPYDALIIANEKFTAYSVLSIIDILLRFSVVVVLIFFSSYRVLWYAGLLLLASLIIRIINATFCKIKFKQEAKYKRVKDKSLFQEMFTFAGWNFFGNLGYWLTMSGLDYILNQFGGLIINAARSISNQVFTNIQSFIGDMNTSFRPRSMMLITQKNIDEYYKLMSLNCRMSFIVSSLLCVTFILNCEGLLKIWLREVPEYAIIFCQTILLYSIVRSLRGPIDIFMKGKGKLKQYQLSECIITIINLPVSCFALSRGVPSYFVFIIMTFLEIINFIIMLFIAKRQCDFDLGFYTKYVLNRVILTSLVVGIVSIILHLVFAYITINVILASFITIILLSIIEFYTLLTSIERSAMYKQMTIKFLHSK